MSWRCVRTASGSDRIMHATAEKKDVCPVTRAAPDPVATARSSDTFVG
jgi:hypothetical protein